MTINDRVYLDTPSDWDALAATLRSAGIIGLDTEFYGLDVRKESCVGRARVHVWSVATRTGRRSPRGFDRARGWVLPAAALTHPSLRAVLEDASIRKCVHNQAVDDHAIHNHGVELRGCINTLGLARWKWPGLVTAGGFGLKNLMAVKLAREPIAEFKQVVGYERIELVSRWKKERRTECQCGVEGCRKRNPTLEGLSGKVERALIEAILDGDAAALLVFADRLEERGDLHGALFVRSATPAEVTLHFKTKIEEQVEVVREKVIKDAYPLETIVPGHVRWDLLVRYAAEDAVAALEIEELATKQRDPAPWPYGENRPQFSQDVEDCIVLMEREGFPVDVPWCRERAAKAIADEEKELAWLFRWHSINGPPNPDLATRETVDAVWSSPKQLVAYFDEMGFPRSPIWKKGRVKRDDVKLDATALEWIAKAHKPSAQFIRHLLHLKRVRSGKKYLVKLRDSGGHVNPICGPAGDGDDRNGAVTGRLGIKGQLEAQQLPTKEELDLYQVRRAIVANHREDCSSMGMPPEPAT